MGKSTTWPCIWSPNICTTFKAAPKSIFQPIVVTPVRAHLLLCEKAVSPDLGGRTAIVYIVPLLLCRRFESPLSSLPFAKWASHCRVFVSKLEVSMDQAPARVWPRRLQITSDFFTTIFFLAWYLDWYQLVIFYCPINMLCQNIIWRLRVVMRGESLFPAAFRGCISCRHLYYLLLV